MEQLLEEVNLALNATESSFGSREYFQEKWNDVIDFTGNYIFYDLHFNSLIYYTVLQITMHEDFTERTGTCKN